MPRAGAEPPRDACKSRHAGRPPIQEIGSGCGAGLIQVARVVTMRFHGAIAREGGRRSDQRVKFASTRGFSVVQRRRVPLLPDNLRSIQGASNSNKCAGEAAFTFRAATLAAAEQFCNEAMMI